MGLATLENQIINLISSTGGISRKELAKRCHISQASITKITKHLMDNHFIIEGERVGSGLGRKEVLLNANPGKFTFLGVDIGGYKIRLAVSDNNLKLIHQKEFYMSQLKDETNKAGILAQRIVDFLNESGASTHAMSAVGIGVTGIVNAQQGIILNIPNAEYWDDIPISSVFENSLGCPVFLEEGGRTMALAEKLVGQAKGVNDFIAVQIGFGLVAGIIINGQVLRGVNNVAGLLGHTTVDENGIRCLCGNYGCLENIITFPMLEKDYRNREGKNDSFLTAYHKNEKVCLDVCIDAGKALGIALSNVVNLFNPQAIYVGGPIFDHIPLIFEETKRTIILRANRFATTSLKIQRNSYGDLQGVVGALSLARLELMKQINFN